jgi:hypothetical protein
MNSLVLAIVAAIIIVVAIVLFFAHVLSFDGSLLITLGATAISVLLGGRLDAGKANP